jgi:hypothetical protein
MNTSRIRWHLVLERTGRGILLAAVGAMGWYTLHGVSWFMKGRQVQRPPESIGDVEPARAGALDGCLPQSPSALRLQHPDGFWRFPGWDWELGRSDVSKRELGERLADVQLVRNADDVDPVHEEGDFLRVLRMLAVRRELPDGIAAYSLDGEAFKVRICTRTAGKGEYVVGGMGAFMVGEGSWALVELRRRFMHRSGTTDGDAQLLPLPEDSRMICARTARDGEVLLELVELRAEPDTLRWFWGEHGWCVRDAPTGDAGSWSCICSKADRIVHAWVPLHNMETGMIVLSAPMALKR